MGGNVVGFFWFVLGFFFLHEMVQTGCISAALPASVQRLNEARLDPQPAPLPVPVQGACLLLCWPVLSLSFAGGTAKAGLCVHLIRSSAIFLFYFFARSNIWEEAFHSFPLSLSPSTMTGTTA